MSMLKVLTGFVVDILPPPPPSASTQTSREHRFRVNPCDFIRMLSFDRIMFNFILSCFKTQLFCFHIIAAMQQLSALQQASLILKGYQRVCVA